MKTLCRKAFCQRPCAIMLEYSCFHFSVFSDDCNKVVHSLWEFLAFVDTLMKLSRRLPRMWSANCSTFNSKDIVHRDLKNANVLVSNQHYTKLSSTKDISKAFQKAPISCKVINFGKRTSMSSSRHSCLPGPGSISCTTGIRRRLSNQ